MKKIWFLCLSLFLAASVTADERTPELIVEDTSAKMLEIIQNDSDRIRNDSAYINQVVNEVVLPIVDLPAMGKLILGPHWKSASEAQRERFIAEFRDMLVRTYAKSLADYGDAKITVIPNNGEQKGKYRRVNTELDLGSGTPLQVEYVFRRAGEEWKAFDLLVDGLSLIKNFRTSFNQEINDTSLDALIERLAGTNSEVEPEPVS